MLINNNKGAGIIPSTILVPDNRTNNSMFEFCNSIFTLDLFFKVCYFKKIIMVSSTSVLSLSINWIFDYDDMRITILSV